MNENIVRVIDLLQKFGYEQCGSTQSYKIITAKSFPLPGAIIKGRMKFRKQCSADRATVGIKTICLYKVVNAVAQDFENYRTAEIESIEQSLAKKARDK